MHFPGTLLAVFKARFIYVCGWSLFVSLTRARAKSKRRWDSESRGPAVGGGVCRQTAAKDLGFLTTTARHFFPAWSYELPVSLQLLPVTWCRVCSPVRLMDADYLVRRLPRKDSPLLCGRSPLAPISRSSTVFSSRFFPSILPASWGPQSLVDSCYPPRV